MLSGNFHPFIQKNTEYMLPPKLKRVSKAKLRILEGKFWFELSSTRRRGACRLVVCCSAWVWRDDRGSGVSAHATERTGWVAASSTVKRSQSRTCPSSRWKCATLVHCTAACPPIHTKSWLVWLNLSQVNGNYCKKKGKT